MGDHLTHDRSIREHEQEATVIPTREQQGSVDPVTWRVVPGDGNDAAEEGGTWAITGGDGDENAFYLEVLDAERPREVAELIVETMAGRARRSRLEGALAEVERERLRSQAEDDVLDPANPHLVEVAKLAALVERIGDVGRELNRDRFHTGREELDKHLYERLTRVAATAVAWMEGILAREARNGREAQDDRDTRDARDVWEAQDGRDVREVREAQNGRDIREAQNVRDIRGVQNSGSAREPRSTRDASRVHGAGDPHDARDV